MTFSATATIQSIEKLNDKFFKVLLQDDRRNHIIVNIPVEKEAELSLNTKISVWGNASAFQYQSKWYNNLFAQTVVPENKKYLLLECSTTDEESKSFKIREYNGELFTEEYITKKYRQPTEENEIQTADNKATSLTQAEIKNRLLLKLSKPIDFVNLEYSHLQNAISKRLVLLNADTIQSSESTYFFTKKQASANLIFFQKTEGELVKLSDFAP